MDDEGEVSCLAWEHMHLKAAPNWETPCLDDSFEHWEVDRSKEEQLELFLHLAMLKITWSIVNLFDCTKIAELSKELQRKAADSASMDYISHIDL